ncbi:putative cytoplasmic protein [Salinisphaera sp. PC39]
MRLLDRLAEEHISAAAERGELDDLPGAGRPLKLDDDRFVPEELRAGYRLLKNAGYLPPELQTRREIASVEELLERADPDSTEHALAQRRLSLLRARLGEGRMGQLRAAREYQEAVLRRLGGDD